MDRWLARLRHDLIKHAAWRARDLRDAIAAGRPAHVADVVALRRALLELPDTEGQPAGLLAVWRSLRAELDSLSPTERAALDRFGALVEAVVDALQHRAGSASDDSDHPADAPALCDAVLGLDAAFDTLAHDVKPRA